MTIPVLIAALVLAPMPLQAPIPSRPAAAFLAAGADALYTSSDSLRPQSDRAATWLRAALERSPTVARLVARIEDSDVLVYLDIRRDLPAGVAACLTWMAATPTRRLLRATLRPGLRRADAIAMIAHELQHVVEVIEHPEVRSEPALLALYARIGHATAVTGRHWDTVDAIAQGTLARAEALNPTRVGRPADARKGT